MLCRNKSLQEHCSPRLIKFRFDLDTRTRIFADTLPGSRPLRRIKSNVASRRLVAKLQIFSRGSEAGFLRTLSGSRGTARIVWFSRATRSNLLSFLASILRRGCRRILIVCLRRDVQWERSALWSRGITERSSRSHFIVHPVHFFPKRYFLLRNNEIILDTAIPLTSPRRSRSRWRSARGRR